MLIARYLSATLAHRRQIPNRQQTMISSIVTEERRAKKAMVPIDAT
jgi:hypothetical protein